jgi:nicotinate phosphoribosyltransferase
MENTCPMSVLSELYRPSLALLTDLYELTMAYGYWKLGLADREAVFQVSFRSNPFRGGYTLACGLESVLDYIEAFRFERDDLNYLATLVGHDGQALFAKEFLDYLATLRLGCAIDAMPEGTVVFPGEPMFRIQGPMLQCQLLETPLLNLLNFQSLIATKAARICSVTNEDPVLEFGLRRAQGIDGALSASRAAYIGGVAATSNVLAGRLFGIPVRGTHAHSWVMLFDDELESFRAFARAMPNNCTFLVDTYDTLTGVRRAAQVGRELAAQGHRLMGVRLDSGDLAYLSIEARKILDAAGLKDAVIVGSNDLDETIIQSLKEQGATIGVWGVGTRLVTGYDQPALGGVYKLSAVRDQDGHWKHRVKLSEQVVKVSLPGLLQVRRYRNGDGFCGDMIVNQEQSPTGACQMIDPFDVTRRRTFADTTPYEELLVPVLRGGACVYPRPKLHEIRARAADQLSRFHTGIKRLLNPHRYPVGLEQGLYQLRNELVLQARRQSDTMTSSGALAPGGVD